MLVLCLCFCLCLCVRFCLCFCLHTGLLVFVLVLMLVLVCSRTSGTKAFENEAARVRSLMEISLPLHWNTLNRHLNLHSAQSIRRHGPAWVQWMFTAERFQTFFKQCIRTFKGMCVSAARHYVRQVRSHVYCYRCYIQYGCQHYCIIIIIIIITIIIITKDHHH